MRRLILVAAAFLSGAAGGCFLKPAAAPGFRYTCETNSDCLARDCKGGLIPMADAEGLIEGCDSPEVKADGTLGVGYRQTCIAGLCEFACGFYTVGDDCPPASGFSFCFNGRCATTCGTDDLTKYNFETNDDYCTPDQRCIPIQEGQIEPDLFEGMGGQGSINISSLPDGAGFCGVRCDAEDAPDCPPGEYCTGAVCLPGCTEPDATPCADGTICLAFGDLSACILQCDYTAEMVCPQGQSCVPGLDICQPSCLDDSDCDNGLTCSVDVGVCIPDELIPEDSSSEGGSESTGS
jgi:hypothetical protein